MFGQGFDSPQLHHATEVGSSAGFLSFLRGGAVGSAPLLLAFVKQTGCTLARHDTPVSWRPPTWALAVRRLPSAPPTLRADARAARYKSISPGTMTDTQLQWSARMPYCPDLIGTTSDEHLPSKKGLFIVKTCRSNGFTWSPPSAFSPFRALRRSCRRCRTRSRAGRRLRRRRSPQSP